MIDTMTIDSMPQSESPSDAQLIARSRAQDEEAFRELVDRHKNLVVNYLTRLTCDRDRAEDFAQETFVRLYQTMDRYREEGQMKAYLLRIATNLVRSEERRNRRWQILRPFFSNETPPADPGPHEELVADEEQQLVSRALTEVDLTYRAPLVLREIEGRSYQEIAQVLGLNEGTVKSRLNRGRNLLKQKLEPYWQTGDLS
jgi:RNA polymerase sigma-70 factor (ECF subfamily)